MRILSKPSWTKAGVKLKLKASLGLKNLKG